MKNITLHLLLLLPSPLLAQLPYSSVTAVPAHMTRSYEIHERSDVPQLDLPFSGLGITWDLTDYRSMEPGDETWYFEPASATPYASLFPNTNVVAWYEDIYGSREYQYFNNSPFELRLLGGVFQNGQNPQIYDFCPDPFLIMDYPMNMGSGVQQVYDCPGGSGDVDNWVIVGTGSVQVGTETMTDLVLWRTVYSGANNAFHDTAYFWTQADNVLYPVVRYHPGGGTVKIRLPYLTEMLSVEEHTSRTFNIFPNPASGTITISTEGERLHRIGFIDAAGRVVRSIGLNNSVQAQVDVHDLPSGIYVLDAVDDQGLHLRQRLLKN